MSIRNMIRLSTAMGVGLLSFAGARLVLNGGGMGEMRASFLLNEVPKALEFCIQSEAACGLGGQEILELQKVPLLKEAGVLSLDYRPSCGDQPSKYIPSEKRMVIESCQLYSENGQPLSYEGLTELFLDIFSESFEVLTEIERGRLKASVALYLQINELNTWIQFNPEPISITWLHRRGELVVMALNLGEETVDLTPELKNALDCENLEVKKANQAQKTQGDLSFKVEWACTKNAELHVYRGQLLILDLKGTSLPSIKVLGRVKLK